MAGGTEWPAVLSAFSDTVVAIAAVVATILAAKGLNAWRIELVGRRKYELAEGVLSVLQELSEVMGSIRSPMMHASEIAKVERGADESEELHQLRSTYSAAWLRYSEHAEFFGRLRALRFKVAVLLDAEHAKPLNDAVAVVDDVLRAGSAAFMYARFFNEQAKRHWAGLPARPDQEDWATKLHEQEDIYWWTGKPDDKISLRLQAANSDAERLYRPMLK